MLLLHLSAKKKELMHPICPSTHDGSAVEGAADKAREVAGPVRQIATWAPVVVVGTQTQISLVWSGLDQIAIHFEARACHQY